MSKKILYDLGATGLGIALWFTPSDFTKAIGYSLSIVFSGSAYCTGICQLNKERNNDEVEGIQYEASIDFYERLLESHIDSALEVAATKIESNTLEKLIPLLAHKSNLEKQIQQSLPIHPEMSEEDREQAARTAIESAFVEPKNKSDCPSQITEETIRNNFPESMDSTSWKAICKALANGSSKDEIVKDVLGCNAAQLSIGMAYLQLLIQKYL